MFLNTAFFFFTSFDIYSLPPHETHLMSLKLTAANRNPKDGGACVLGNITNPSLTDLRLLVTGRSDDIREDCDCKENQNNNKCENSAQMSAAAKTLNVVLSFPLVMCDYSLH